MHGKLFRICIIIFAWSSANAQKDANYINQYLEYVIEIADEDVDIVEITEQLLRYINHPLNINKASNTEIFNFPLFSQSQALEICNHRKKFGPFLSIYEFQLLPSFNHQVLNQVRPLIAVYTHPITLKTVRKNIRKGKHQFMSLCETTSPKNIGQLRKTNHTSDSLTYYKGSNIYSNIRYRFDFKKHLSWGINLEKDAGEQFSFNKQKTPLGYDHQSLYLSLNDVGKIKSLQIGDFHVNLGQGLTLSTGLAFGKSSLITNTKRNFSGFSSYRSLRENAYMRGVALSVNNKNITLGSFISYKKLDGVIHYLAPDSNNERSTPFVETITEDGGYHRTINEQQQINKLADLQTGGYIEYENNTVKVGGVLQYRKLSIPIRQSTEPYSFFSFQGDNYLKNGIYYDAVFRNINLFGEWSYCFSNLSLAQNHGALISIHRKLDLSVLYRNYHPGFITYQTNGFGENSNAKNEKGLYLGYQIKLKKYFSIVGYYDLFQNLNSQFKSIAPSRGFDLWTELRYKPSKIFNAYYRFRKEKKQINSPKQSIYNHENNQITRHRVHSSYKLSKSIELRNRIETTLIKSNQPTTRGSLIYQDLILKPKNKAYQWSTRIALSRVEDYKNRIYSFEKSPLYDYPMFNHSYSGIRYYILFRYTTLSNTQLWFKYGYTQHDTPIESFDEQYAIGSGLNKVAGNKKYTFTLQLKHVFN